MVAEFDEDKRNSLEKYFCTVILNYDLLGNKLCTESAPEEWDLF